jgi:hypothetical protein
LVVPGDQVPVKPVKFNDLKKLAVVTLSEPEPVVTLMLRALVSEKPVSVILLEVALLSLRLTVGVPV